MSSEIRFARVILASLPLTWSSLSAAPPQLDEVIVSGSLLKEQSQLDTAASVTVIGSTAVRDSTHEHFQELIAQAPNLNWAAGSSRPRYFQIRGIGEREQYEGAPNPSVGFLIDDIDFTGVGMAATLFDVSQVEIMRGPQSARLGANALAGIISLHSADPEEKYESRVQAEVGDYATRSLGFSATGPVSSLDSFWRFSVQKYRSDGFRTDTYLHRDDTNNRDELSLRGKWRWQPGDNSRLDLTLMHVNLANGYDAFSIDNSRNTLSDNPGEDSQRVTAGAAKWVNEFDSGNTLSAIATATDSYSIHAYDGDWGNARDWLPFTYDFIYRAEREHRTQTVETRLASPLRNDGIGWVVGFYALRLNERIHEISRGILIDPDPVFGYVSALDDSLRSDYDATNLAVFAQLDGHFTNQWNWTVGLREEQRDADYADVGNWGGDPARRTQDSRRDSMLGGNVSVTYAPNKDARIYGTIARGYKAGGFNLGSARARQATFAPEFLWNYEAGIKSALLDGQAYVESSLFYMRRTNTQVRSGTQLVAGDPNSFVFFTSNADQGVSYGLESSLRWLVTERLEIGTALGLLRTSASGILDGAGNVRPRRALAQAPEYQLQLNATWRTPKGYFARIDQSMTDDFYFDVDHDQQAKAHALTNIKLGYEADRWHVYAWAINVFDKQYATRGFFFGNEPPNFENKLYIQNGDPRQIGLSAEWVVR